MSDPSVSRSLSFLSYLSYLSYLCTRFYLCHRNQAEADSISDTDNNPK